MKPLPAFLLLAFVAVSAVARPYRALVLPGHFDKSAEQHGYDRALDRLGIEIGYATKEDFETGAVFNRLSEYDLIAVPPTFHDRPRNLPEGQTYAQDMRRHAPQIRKWLAAGGIIVLHDCNYENRLAWLADIDPALAIQAAGCSYKQPKRLAEGVSETFFTAPMSLEYGVHWNHMAIPEGSAWKPLATCATGDPIVACCPYGKGLVYGMSSWLGDPTAMFANVRAHAPLLVNGLSIRSMDVPEPAVGGNVFSVVVANASSSPRKVALVFGSEKASETIPSGGEKALRLSVRISGRGTKRLSLFLECNGGRAILFDRDVHLRNLFELGSTRYRNLLSLDRRHEDILLRSYVSPDREDVARAVVRLRAFSPDGSELSATDTPAQTGTVSSTVKFPLDLPAGIYRVRGELVSRDGMTIGMDEGAVEILPSVPGQVVIDEDLNLLVDGEPFLPLGMYHVEPGEFSDVSELGVNMIQLFGWFWAQGLERAWEQGFRTVWAPWDCTPEETARCYGANPSAMMWYLLDEPSDKDIPTGEALNADFHAADRQHPTFLCSCTPNKFDRFAGIADVFGPDPYPHDWDDPGIVARWMDRAYETIGEERPIVCIVQSHLMETNPEWIAMTYLALCHRSRGVFWYCWSQQGGGTLGVGIKHNAEHRRDLPRIASELRAMAPALLNAPSCDYFVSNGLHGVSCQDPETKARYLILVNSATNGPPVRASIAWKGVDPATRQAHGAFGGEGFSMKNGVVDAKLAPLEVRTLYADGPAPVAVTLPPPPQAPSGKGRTLQVGGEGKFRTIQSAVDASLPGDTILVAPGVYEPFATKNDHLVIRGEEGPAKTIVDGGLTNRAATLTARPYGSMAAETNTVLEGLTLRAGAADALALHKHFGGCVLGGTLRGCVVADGTAQYGGGVAHSRLEGATVEKCHASKMGGGATLSVLENCTIRENVADYDGGGIAFSRADGCEISANRAGRDGGGARFGRADRCRFLGNEAGRDGGGAKIDGDGARSSLFDGNRAARRGGGTEGTSVNHCTFVNNMAGEGGGVAGGSAVQQSILWENAATNAPGTDSYSGSRGRIKNCCIQWNATNALPSSCIAVDPRFRGRDDYRVRADSPCIDLGGGVCAPDTLDLAGNPRRLGRMTDAGCYEIGALPFAPFVDKKAELFVWTPPGENLEPDVGGVGALNPEDSPKRPPFRQKIQLPSGRETTDLRLRCRFRCKKNQRGPLMRFESETGVWLEMAVHPKSGRLYGTVGYPAMLDTDRETGEPGRTRVKSSPQGVVVDDGEWHEAEFALHALNVDVALTELSLDGTRLPPEFPWFRECSEALRLKNGTLFVGGATDDVKDKGNVFGGEIVEAALEVFPGCQY